MSNRFQGVFDARKGAAEASAEEAPPPSPAPAVEVQEKPKANGAAKAPKPVATEKRRGRPPGKRSDGEYVQVTSYIRQETHRAVKMALLAEDKGQEFSELVQELLVKWLKPRT